MVGSYARQPPASVMIAYLDEKLPMVIRYHGSYRQEPKLHRGQKSPDFLGFNDSGRLIEICLMLTQKITDAPDLLSMVCAGQVCPYRSALV